MISSIDKDDGKGKAKEQSDRVITSCAGTVRPDRAYVSGGSHSSRLALSTTAWQVKFQTELHDDCRPASGFLLPSTKSTGGV